ncbi:MAG: helix-turn-helix transcriptional regulator [Betaproteobacteria bacterium]|nr:helix-turn-helix transcriptional regulator [Betaproteobacteria bacterium]
MQQFEAQQIGARIARARKEAGLTQEDLAEMASFSKRSLQDYEAGVSIPYRHLRELGELLNRTAQWFLYGEVGVSESAEADRLRQIVREELAAALAPVERMLEAELRRLGRARADVDTS